jgi:hypothetical protein
MNYAVSSLEIGNNINKIEIIIHLKNELNEDYTSLFTINKDMELNDFFKVLNNLYIDLQQRLEMDKGA